MFDWFRKWRKKAPEEKALEPFSLAPNPMVKEGQLAAVVAVPLLAFLVIILYVAKTFYITVEEFALLTGVGFGLWICMIIVVYTVSVQSAIKHFLFDREFGFTERLHPRFEIYCKPEDIRCLIGKKDKIENIDMLKERLKEFGLEKIADKFNDEEKFPKYLYYFKHKHVYEGWDKEKHEVLPFKTHVVFLDKPFDEQFVFGAGQENWWGPILFNHTHAESDNVKVLSWGLDPFTNEPMPVCVLKYSSIYYSDGEKAPEDIETLDAFRMLIAHQHGLIDSQRKKIETLAALVKAKFTEAWDLLKFAEEKADIDIALAWMILKERRKSRLAQIGKILMYAIMIGGIVLIVWILAYYMFGVWMPLFE